MGKCGNETPRDPIERQKWMRLRKLNPEAPQWSEWRQEDQGTFPWVPADANASQRIPEAEPYSPGLARRESALAVVWEAQLGNSRRMRHTDGDTGCPRGN